MEAVAVETAIAAAPITASKERHADFFQGASRKVGNFSVAFNDCTIPIAGLPITVTRTYDTRAAGTSGDFGYGWRLAIADIRLEKTANLGKFWFQQGDFTNFLGAFSMVEGKSHKITITFPDGKVYKFQGGITPGQQYASAIDGGTYTFTPIQPTLGTLTVVGSNDIFVNGAPDEQNTFVPATIQDFSGNIFNPTTFQLVTQEGMTYVIDQFNGLQSMTDLNGNTITVTPNGLISSTGKSIVFERDGANRITKITDCAGNPMYYGYDGSGNLISFTDRESNTTQFTFDNTHKLLSIIDPRGITPATNQYDDSGRLQSTTDALGHSVIFNHDLPGRSSTITDRNGNPTTYAYDNDGNVLVKVDALGAETDYTYDLNDNQLTMKDPLGHVWTKTYDLFNNVLTTSDPLGNTTTYTYDTHRHVLTKKDAIGSTWTNTYDIHNNLSTSTNPLGDVTTFIYDYHFNPFGSPVSMIDADNNTWLLSYDTLGNKLGQTDPNGHTVSIAYDANNNAISSTTNRTANGVVETLITTIVYDKLGQATHLTYADGSSSQVQYNSIGKESMTADRLGHKTNYSYDSAGRPSVTTYSDATTESITYDADGRRLSTTDRSGHITQFQHDLVGRMTNIVYADNSSASNSYDLAGRLTSRTDQRGNTTNYSYDAANRRTSITDAQNHTTVYTHDLNGNETTMLDANGHTTSYKYDLENRRTQTIFHDGTLNQTTYDKLGRISSRKDQAGKATQFGYDSLGRLTSVTDALGEVTLYTYDELGAQLTQTDANNHTTTYTYDLMGRKIKRTLPAGMAETFGYDDGGRLTSRQDFNGKTTIYTYDDMNRLTSKRPDASFGAPVVQYAYTPTGKRSTMVDASGTTTYGYDALDRLITKATPEGELIYEYDACSNVSSVHSSNVNGVNVSYTYDNRNRISTATDNRHGTTTTTYSYDNVGRLLEYDYPNGVHTSLGYDNLNRLSSIASTSGIPISSYNYTLGASGNRTGVAELSGRQVTYIYDDAYQLSSETIRADPTSENNGSVEYLYDSVGNRLARNSSIGAVPSSSITFDENDRASSDNYDANWNTAGRNGNSYIYDFENRIVSANNGAISIVYDGDGNRVSKTVNGLVTKYLVDMNNLTGFAQVVEELDSANNVQCVYTYGRQLVSQDRLIQNAWTKNYYGYDGHGNVRYLTSSTGVISDKYDYDAFGVLIMQAGQTPNRYLFSGEQFDSDLGLYYVRARYLEGGS